MTRSLRKGFFIDYHLYEKVLKVKNFEKKVIKTWSRRSIVLPDMVGLTLCVHNGKTFNQIFITEDLVGHRLGEFSLTRTFRSHSGVNKNKVEGKK